MWKGKEAHFKNWDFSCTNHRLSLGRLKYLVKLVFLDRELSDCRIRKEGGYSAL